MKLYKNIIFNKKYCAVILLCIQITMPVIAENDTTAILTRTAEKHSPIKNFFTVNNISPAMKQYQHRYKLTTINLDSEHETQTQPIQAQEGDGYRTAGITVSSHIPQNNKTLWGNASYHSGTKYSQTLNETSDVALLYPYLSGDTTGGNLQTETYKFAGGYAHHHRQIILGIHSAFRAQQEYRATDPRPANTVADLTLSAGAAYRPQKQQYTTGVAIHLRKYRQKNQIDFYNELGDIKTYHYTGLGTDYARFRTKAGQSYYNGQSAGATIHLTPKTSGLHLAADYNNFNFEKIISSLNNLNMLHLNEHATQIETGYSISKQTATRALKLSGRHTHRTGKENIFGDETSNSYPFLTTVTRYHNTHSTLSLTALYSRNTTSATQYTIIPQSGLETQTEQYTYPYRKISRTTANISIQTAIHYTKQKYISITQAIIKHTIPVSNTTNLNINDQEDINASTVALIHNNQIMSSRQTTAYISERVDIPIRNNRSLYLEVHYQYGKYIYNISTNRITAITGINF
jgi:hypothetical protein